MKTDSVRDVGHVPVLLHEVVDCFSGLKGIVLDGTFGGGGHSRALLESHTELSVFGMDRDPAAASRAEPLREAFGERFCFASANFGDIETHPEIAPLNGLAGALFDLGVSSYQLDEPSRGFSFRAASFADMRMNPSQGRSAAEFLETASPEEITRAIRDYGEEKSWKRVVRALLSARGTGLLQQTNTLADLIAGAVHSHPGMRIHPATQSFQGIRIAVNEELEAIERGIPACFHKLSPGGVLAVITFHSLEDRMVKRLFNVLSGRPEHRDDPRPQDLRVCQAELLTRKPVSPTAEEISDNPRSRSARLRVLRKLSSKPLRPSASGLSLYPF